MYSPTHIVTYGTFPLMEVVTCVGQFFGFVITSGSGFLKNFKIKGKLLFQGQSQVPWFFESPPVKGPYTLPLPASSFLTSFQICMLKKQYKHAHYVICVKIHLLFVL